MSSQHTHIPSIFNDVVGPVMRGPSSSHSAAALRIGRICRELMEGDPGRVVVSYDSRDALATTHESQGSDMGMKGGVLGFDPDDERLLDPDPCLADAGIDVSFRVTEITDSRPNLYQVQLENGNLQVEVSALSTGGGMIELIRINDTELSFKGDRQVELWITGEGKVLLQDPKSSGTVKRILSPLLPTPLREHIELPFSSCRQMMQYNLKKEMPAWELAVAYESAIGGRDKQQVFQMMQELYVLMRSSIDAGMRGTQFEDRIYGAQSGAYLKRMEAGGLAGGETVHKITLYVSAIMEVKSSMGVIVAAPTAGSCGTFPGAVIAVADAHGFDEDQIVKALLAGSLAGIFIATASTFSAEICGCQAECGSAAGMAAAAITALMGGSVEQCMAASSLALQNSLGMICDPIAARVEAPCLGKNVSSALNALVCANMSLAGFDHLIPLDEVIETMDRVGRSLPHELRCTALGGLATTHAAREIEKKLKDGKQQNGL